MNYFRTSPNYTSGAYHPVVSYRSRENKLVDTVCVIFVIRGKDTRAGSLQQFITPVQSEKTVDTSDGRLLEQQTQAQPSERTRGHMLMPIEVERNSVAVSSLYERQADLRSQLSAANERQESLRSQLHRLENRNRALRDEVARVQRDNAQLRLQNAQEKEEYERKIKKLQKRIEEVEEDKETGEESIRQQEQKIKLLQRRLEDTGSEMQTLATEREQLHIKLQEVTAAKQRNQTDLEKLVQKEEEKSSKLQSLSEELQEERKHSKLLCADLDTMKRSQAALQQKAAGIVLFQTEMQRAEVSFGSLSAGNVAYELERRIYAYVLPQFYDSTKQHYTLKLLKRTLQSTKSFSNNEQERLNAKKRWHDLRKCIGWSDDKHADLLDELKQFTGGHISIQSTDWLRHAVNKDFALDEYMKQEVTEMVTMMDKIEEKVKRDAATY